MMTEGANGAAEASLLSRLFLPSPTAPAIFPLTAVSPPDGRRLAIPNHEILRETGPCTRAIACSGTRLDHPPGRTRLVWGWYQSPAEAWPRTSGPGQAHFLKLPAFAFHS